jgi:heme oxygenase
VINSPHAADGARRPAAELKLRTRDWHQQLDRHATLNGLMSPLLTVALYREILCRFERCHRGLEEALGPLIERVPGSPLAGIDAALWRRSPDLAGDIRRLDQVAGAGARVASARGDAGRGAAALVPQLQDEPDAWGCLYVVAGSALGGRVIERAVRAQLGAPVADSLQFLHGRSSNLGSAWQALCTAIDVALAEPASLERAIVKAREVFAYFSVQLASAER